MLMDAAGCSKSEPVMIDHTFTPAEGKPTTAIPTRPPAGPAGHPPQRRSKLRWLWLPVLAALCWAGYKYWPQIGPMLSGPTAPATKGGKKGGAGGRIPVVATRARRGNIGVYDVSLGAVTPINTVTVTSVVSGQL